MSKQKKTSRKLYQELNRPQFHFSPKANWMNDPNGMVYYEGEYHLFYQYHPDGNVWGPMHWGHAVSKDLVHWEHLPIALYPDSQGYIFSGSAVVDWENSSGLGKNEQPPLIAIYTLHNPQKAKAGTNDHECQAIAYSHDKGRTWTKYAGNPIISNEGKHKDFRDPKVFWDENSRHWILVLSANDHLKIWGSKDLKNWIHLSDWGKNYGCHDGVWECPDLFPMRVENTGEQKWVLIQSLNAGGISGGSGTQYFVGSFDGKTFTLDPGFEKEVRAGKGVWLDYGRDNYAGVTWSDIPAADGRRLFLGWMSNWHYAQEVPTTIWRSAMTLPRELSLKNTAQGYRLIAQPVRELQSLRQQSQLLKPGEIFDCYAVTPELDFSSTLSECILECAMPEGCKANFGIEISNEKGEKYRIGFRTDDGLFYSDRSRAGKTNFSGQFAAMMPIAPRISSDKIVKFQLFLDVASAELFADGGEVCITETFFPSEPFTHMDLYVEGGPVELIRGEVFKLKSIWRPNAK